MQADNDYEGRDTEAELQAHLAEMEAAARMANPIPALPEDEPAPADTSALADALETARTDLETIRARLEVIRAEAAHVVKSQAHWFDRSAHAQLGDYPYLKLAGAMAGSFLVGRALRVLPLGRLISLAVPLALAQVQKDR